MKKAVLFWSGGKDSALALYYAQQNKEIEVVSLVCTLNEEYGRVSMHGIREEAIEKQASLTGLPLLKMWVPNLPDNSEYEKVLLRTYEILIEQGIEVVIFGDIFLEDIRWYRDHLLRKMNLEGYYPLWGLETDKLISDFLSLGFKTIICCLNSAFLDKGYLGTQIDKQFIENLSLIVDPCGENGEFHTFCYSGPIFDRELKLKLGEAHFAPLPVKSQTEEYAGGFWYIDIQTL